ncbi:cysteine hydrolase [Candidatus Kaiserbacteria bacterium]|nr:MAG: cysteine hydrolase [Candidatus Kaiserbacteria bacterium]
MKPALLIIDLQKDFFESVELNAIQSDLVPKINILSGIIREHGVPIIWVRQEMKPDGSDAFIGDRKLGKRFVVAGTEGSKLLDGLDHQTYDLEIIKRRYSPFYKTNLDEMLQALGIDTLIISGINTHACVRMAVIDAYQRDYEVILALDCINSWDEEHHVVTIKYLSGKISAPMTNLQIKDFLEKDGSNILP